MEGRRVRIGDDLTTDGLTRVLEHDPGDLTCTVEAGVRLSELREVLAAHGQRLSLDPPGDPTDRRAPRPERLGPAAASLRRAARPRPRRDARPRATGRSRTRAARSSRTSRATTSRASCADPRAASRSSRAPASACTRCRRPRGRWWSRPTTPRATSPALLRSQLQPSALDVLHPGRVAVLFEGSERAVAAQLAQRRALVGGDEADYGRLGRVAARQASARGRVRFAPGDLAAALGVSTRPSSVPPRESPTSRDALRVTPCHEETSEPPCSSSGSGASSTRRECSAA